MRGFAFTCNTKVYFGTGILEEALNKSTEQIKGNVLIVTTGGSLVKYGHLDRLMECLRNIKTVERIEIYKAISRNPKLEEVVPAIEKGMEIKADVIIGFGGGSAIDAAKAVAAGIPVRADLQCLEEYLLKGKTPGKATLPVIAVPTTAGTGSELSKGAILTSERYQIKSGIRGENILPRIGIVDPVFTWTVPEKTTMETGFDVLAHAVESYVSLNANMFSEILSERAVEIAGRCLRSLKKDPDDHAAREEMSFASMIMGMNLANVGTCLPHRMQYPIGVHTQTSHGAGLAALYPAWLQREYSANSQKIEKVMQLLDIQTEPDLIKENFKRFLHRLDIDYSLEYLGVEKSDIEKLTGQMTGNMAADRLYQDKDTLCEIMEDSI